YCKRSFFATRAATSCVTAFSVASPMIVDLKFDEPNDIPPKPPPPPPPAPPPSMRPLRDDTASPLALTMISLVDVSMMRHVIATVALPLDMPTPPSPNLPPPKPPPPTPFLLSSVPNLVMDPVIRYFTPATLPNLATILASGSARLLFDR